MGPGGRVTAPRGAVVLPVGHLVGGGSGAAARVRIGPEMVELDDAAFTVWALAHGLPDRPVEEPWTREALLTTAAAQGLGDLGATLDALLADRVLVEVDPADGTWFAQSHRLVPLALGLGNDPDAPGTWLLGLLGHPLVQVDGTTFDLVQWSDREVDLWAAVRGVARVARDGGHPDPASTDPAQLLIAVLSTLHALLAVDAVCLDTRYVTA